MKKYIVALCAIFVFILQLSFASCSQASPDPFAYVSAPFRVSVDGELEGMLFKADVYCDPTVTEPDGVMLSALFSSPQSLEGITVTRKKDGSSSARLGGISTDGDCFGALCDILALLIPGKDLLRAERYVDVTEYTVADSMGEVIYRFQGNSPLPGSISGEDFCLTLTPPQTK